ncbi:hypothetical protein KOF26_15300 [Sphingomonas sp. XMGL2]|uniref:5-bromo-4-chloroindolyl phosphate hydrolysis protein n=2 Tax=Sphingomonas quercus TaxID=2842451 RepID=A0ABS6BPN3_9SPHN|nr:hypothetical protein [Sphingomonas quercus]MBU3079224.1 hypothetical protein [Sphingomonas quercus]
MRKGNELLARARGYAFDWAEEAVHRISPEGRKLARRRAERRRAAFLRIARRLIAATAAIFVAVLAAGFVLGPIGLGGLMAAVLAMIIAWVAIVAWSVRDRDMPPERFVQTDLAQLPQRTESWLEAQRPALPAPAQRQVDQISLALEQLGPQLAALDPREPAAIEVRRLVGEELPELVRGYQRVPESLRRQPLNGGLSPDRQLADGLETIGEEIGRMNAQLATGDLHALATQQRYLELKYKGNDAIEGGGS